MLWADSLLLHLLGDSPRLLGSLQSPTHPLIGVQFKVASVPPGSSHWSGSDGGQAGHSHPHCHHSCRSSLPHLAVSTGSRELVWHTTPLAPQKLNQNKTKNLAGSLLGRELLPAHLPLCVSEVCCQTAKSSVWRKAKKVRGLPSHI